ncbi:MAG TPA: HAD hydrolase-like protein [Candidatus Aenigmarchaeota archaeon]|nr:HAD hydrolase-like protein [Candidatus Aenigmarchaeota archaeon]
MTRKNILIKDALGNKVSGVLSIPKDASFVVVMSHGFTSNRNSRLYIQLEKELNAKNIGTVRYEYYGHGLAYGHKKRGLSNDTTITKTVESLKSIIKYLRQRGYNRIGLVGSSFGGLISLIVASQDKKFEFLLLRSPVTNVIELWNERVSGSKNKILHEWKNNDIFHYNREEVEYDLKWEFWTDMQKYNMLKIGEKISCPIFIVHGDKDEIVPIKYSEDFSKTVGARLKIIKGSNHSYSNPKNFIEMKSSIKDFVLKQTESKIKTIIFDWNGVIGDSLALDHFIFLQECKRDGVKAPKSLAFYRNLFNENIFVSMKKLGFVFDDMDEKYKQLYQKHISMSKIFPGMKSVLRCLKKKYSLVLITSNYQCNVDSFIKKYKLEGVFDSILTADTSHSKEANIKNFLIKLSLKKKEVITVGDTVMDIKSARKNGLKIISTVWGYQSKRTLVANNPDYVANKPEDIIKIIGEING